MTSELRCKLKIVPRTASPWVLRKLTTGSICDCEYTIEHYQIARFPAHHTGDVSFQAGLRHGTPVVCRRAAIDMAALRRRDALPERLKARLFALWSSVLWM
jgi:hypothetical protein